MEGTWACSPNNFIVGGGSAPQYLLTGDHCTRYVWNSYKVRKNTLEHVDSGQQK